MTNLKFNKSINIKKILTKKQLMNSDWKNVVKMIYKKIPSVDIIDYILRNKVCLEKNFNGKSILEHSLNVDISFANTLLTLKTNYVNEANTLYRALITKNEYMANFLSSKKIKLEPFLMSDCLVLAIKAGFNDVAKKLLKKGANPNTFIYEKENSYSLIEYCKFIKNKVMTKFLKLF